MAKSDTVVERQFLNNYGEKWRLRIHAETGDGELSGDETGWDEAVCIHGDVADPDVIFSEEEAQWLEQTWHETTGRLLVLPVFNLAVRAMRRGAGPPNSPSGSSIRR